MTLFDNSLTPLIIEEKSLIYDKEIDNKTLPFFENLQILPINGKMTNSSNITTYTLIDSSTNTVYYLDSYDILTTFYYHFSMI